MKINQCGEINYYSFNSFPTKKVIHAVFTRSGGVSPRPWDSLNVGGTNGDSRENVLENRLRIFTTVGRQVESIFDTWQVHGCDIVCAQQPRANNAPHIRADAIITDNPRITLMMRFADCVPVLLFDSVNNAIGLVHTGWQGTVNKVVRKVVRLMSNRYGSQSKNIIAAIGPSIGPDHYEIGKDVCSKVIQSFGSTSKGLLHRKANRVHFDLWEANKQTLLEAGVQQIEVSKICTACNTNEWYSHRFEQGKTGRFGVIFALQG